MTDTSERGTYMKYENVISLQNDLEKLIEKHGQLIEKNDFGSALNVMKNIEYLTSQLRHIGYETMVSKYTLVKDKGEDIDKKVISIWKQNAFGDIKDHEIYYLGEKYENNTYDFLSDLSKGWSTMSDEMKESVYQMIGVKDKPVVEEIVKGFSIADNKWYDVLKFFIETKQSQVIQLDYTNRDNETKHRGTGKTSALVRLSSDYGIPIYSSKSRSYTLKDREKELGVKAIIIDDIDKLNLQQRRDKIVLIDEFIDIKFNRDKYIVIGFQQCTNM